VRKHSPTKAAEKNKAIRTSHRGAISPVFATFALLVFPFAFFELDPVSDVFVESLGVTGAAAIVIMVVFVVADTTLVPVTELLVLVTTQL
jgi:hypothetical protein